MHNEQSFTVASNHDMLKTWFSALATAVFYLCSMAPSTLITDAMSA